MFSMPPKSSKRYGDSCTWNLCRNLLRAAAEADDFAAVAVAAAAAPITADDVDDDEAPVVTALLPFNSGD